MTIDPNAEAREVIRAAYRNVGIDATDRLLDVVVDAVLATESRELAVADVATYAGLGRGTATKLVDLAREALGDAGLR